MSIFVKIPNIKGNVTTQGYEGAIECSDVQFCGVSNRSVMRLGQPSDRFNRAPSFGQLVLVKPQDKSAINFFEAAHNAQVFPSLEIHYVHTGSDITTYAKTKLTNAAVTHYSERATAADKPEELIRLTYTQIERTIVPRDEKNRSGSPLTTGFDIEKAKKL